MYTTYIFFTDEKRFTIMTWWGKTLPVSKWVRNVVAELTKKVPAEALELWYIVLMRRMEALSKPKRFIVVVLYWFTQNLNRDLHFWGLPQPLFSLMGLISTLQFLKAGMNSLLSFGRSNIGEPNTYRVYNTKKLGPAEGSNPIEKVLQHWARSDQQTIQ